MPAQPVIMPSCIGLPLIILSLHGAKLLLPHCAGCQLSASCLAGWCGFRTLQPCWRPRSHMPSRRQPQTPKCRQGLLPRCPQGPVHLRVIPVSGVQLWILSQQVSDIRGQHSRVRKSTCQSSLVPGQAGSTEKPLAVSEHHC